MLCFDNHMLFEEIRSLFQKQGAINIAKTGEEFVNTHVRFDLIRLHAGEKGFSGLFDPYVAAPLYWFASLLDPTLGALARCLSDMPPDSAALYGL
ncbi:hypothetical protein KBX73_12705 [Acetobacter persici]|uniref:hypothetical protein n=1 Tax=Acetobacter persici TaxID=1076596 RepID=UPI0020CE1F59|nr:hypothetical protein [Acetobacter persici]MCP9320619.1 hypothetical protein [Acetobacter persici]